MKITICLEAEKYSYLKIHYWHATTWSKRHYLSFDHKHKDKELDSKRRHLKEC